MLLALGSNFAEVARLPYNIFYPSNSSPEVVSGSDTRVVGRHDASQDSISHERNAEME